MTTGSLIGRDLYVRHTGTDGNSFVQCHRVWDGERFLAARVADAAKANADVKGDAPRRAKVECITRLQYLKERS